MNKPYKFNIGEIVYLITDEEQSCKNYDYGRRNNWYNRKAR